MKYKTTNLDLAAFLACKNFKVEKVNYLSAIHAEIVFTKTKELEKWVQKFNTGSVQVNLLTYLYQRQHLKARARKDAQIAGKVEVKKGAKSHGVVFWYIDDENKIQRDVYDPNNKTQVALKNSGNFYATSVDAAKARAANGDN